MFVFNFHVGSLEQSVKLGQLIFFNFLGNSLSKHHFFQTDNQKAMLFTVFLLFELFSSCSGERKPTENTGHCFTHKFSNFQILLQHPRLTFDWLSVSFFDY